MAPNGLNDGVKSPPVTQENLQNGNEKVLLETPGPRQKLKWINIVSIALVHVLGIYGFYLFLAKNLVFSLVFPFQVFIGFLNAFGVTAGAHRYWTHRTYKATLPMKILLAFCFSISGQNTIPEWVQDHRVHHKFSETNADPHNSNRGFFFAHVGWLMQKKHPDVIRKGKQVDMSDIYEDPVVQFHTKYFIPIKILACFVIPTLIPCYLWNESLHNAFFTNLSRFIITLNGTWSVNSAAHMFGNRPFSNRIRPAENTFVSLISFGEGWHNYHHVFPWDYKAAEFGHFLYNPTTELLDFFAKIGWVYDLKTPSKELVERVAKRFGDGTYHGHCHIEEVPESERENGDLEGADVTPVIPINSSSDVTNSQYWKDR